MSRCQDRTENGTYLSALKCLKCPDGFYLPDKPLDCSSGWFCIQCKVQSPQVETAIFCYSMCPKSVYPFYLVNFYITWAKTSWTYSSNYKYFYCCWFLRFCTENKFQVCNFSQSKQMSYTNQIIDFPLSMCTYF